MPKLNEIKKEIMKQIGEYTAKNFIDFKGKLEKEIAAYLKTVIKDIDRWTQLVAEGSLTQEEYYCLYKALKTDALIKSLTLLGLAVVKLEKIKDDILDIFKWAALVARGLAEKKESTPVKKKEEGRRKNNE